jgi:DNA-binding NarL/FixJ family response regulator
MSAAAVVNYRIRHKPYDPNRPEYLTRRETQIARLLTIGNGNKEIAAMLNLSQKTVETHRANLMRKLKAHNLIQLVCWSLRTNLVQVQDLPLPQDFSPVFPPAPNQ